MSADEPEVAAAPAAHEPAPDPAPEPVPVVEAEDLGLVGPEGPVFTAVSLAVAPGRATVLVGPSGSGRSSLLLALCGRMRGTTGSLRSYGRPVRTGRELRALRRSTSVARIGSFVRPEARLSVTESVTERALLDGVRPAVGERAFAAVEDVFDVHLDRTVLVEQLGAYEQAVLAVGLALVRPADLVVLDDLDADLDLTDQRRLVDGLVRLAGSGLSGSTGPAVLAASTEPRSVQPDALLVSLAAPQEDL